MNKYFGKNDGGEDTPTSFMFNEQCPVYNNTISFNVFDILLDGEIREPSYYRNAFQTLRMASEGDQVRILINSPGGRLDSAISFINLIQETDADVVAVLEGDTHSAASIIALNCPSIIVKPFTSMMIHNASFGSVGTVQNVVGHVNFSSSQTERILNQTYKYFLTEEELQAVIHNKEIWLRDEEIGQRLERMFHEQRKEDGGCDCLECVEEEVPTPAPRKRVSKKKEIVND